MYCLLESRNALVEEYVYVWMFLELLLLLISPSDWVPQADKEALVAETIVDSEEGIAALQRALSDANDEMQALYRDYIEEKKSHERAEQECIELGIQLSNVQLEVDRMKTQALGWKETMEGQGGTIATLRDNMERLVKENHDLKEEIGVRKQEVRIQSSFDVRIYLYTTN